MTDYYTENLADFGYREIKMLRNILDAWMENGLPKDFYSEDVRLAFNRHSGDVFLTNGGYQCAMMNGNSLETYYNLSCNGEEGFLADFLESDPEDFRVEDIQYLLNIADIVGYELSPPWLALAQERKPDPV